MNIVAVTGGIGSGKSEATHTFESLGIPVVDLDDITHALTTKATDVTKQIAVHFGQTFIQPDGALHRQKMREYVFNDDAARLRLEGILHPAIHQQAMAMLNHQADALYQVLSIPLLDQDSIYLPLLQHILVVDCDQQTQIQRVVERSGLSETVVQKIIDAQPSREVRLSLANTVILNTGSLDMLRDNVRKFHQNYIKTCIVSQ